MSELLPVLLANDLLLLLLLLLLLYMRFGCRYGRHCHSDSYSNC